MESRNANHVLIQVYLKASSVCRTAFYPSSNIAEPLLLKLSASVLSEITT